MKQSLRNKVYQRSRGWCESLNCREQAHEIHHLLTKGRGGRNLDRVGETYHLIHLCGACHEMCDGQDAYDNGMLIEGYVVWDKLRQRPVYTGPDEYLSKEYGE